MTRPDDEPVFRYLTDENVTRSATNVLRTAGRDAFESREVIGGQAADKVLEWVAHQEGLILVSRDRDFKAIVEGVSARGLRRAAKAIWLRMDETREAKRLAQCLPMIENLLRHAIVHALDLEYIQIFEEEINVKYRFPS